MKRLLWLRNETKAFEQRTPLTPSAAKQLLDLGHDVIVESSPLRVFKDQEYMAIGCTIVEANSWKTKAPENAIIFGLKELEDEELPLVHRHVFFGHCYKNQNGSKKLLSRFVQGGGKLYDLEYLVDENHNRIAAFGLWAGFCGAGLGLDLWVHQQLGLNYNTKAPLRPYKDQNHFIKSIELNLKKLSKKPRALVIGANGRCGQGATKFLNALNIDATKWGSKDTINKGPIKEILDYDLLINTVLMKTKTAPFLTKEILNQDRNLTTISDISCDPTGPCNPLPIYNECTTMDIPKLGLAKDLQITAIDHLPSLLPRESSEDYCNQLFPFIVQLMNNEIENSPWEKSLELFYQFIFEMDLNEIALINKTLKNNDSDYLN